MSTEETKKLGELCFEHDIEGDPPDHLYRLDAVRYWHSRSTRTRSYYPTREAAEKEAARLEQQEDTVLHVTHYVRADG